MNSEKVKETSEEIAARVRAGLPSYLRQPLEQIAEDKRAAQLRAASFTRSRLTEEERLIARGCQIEEIARANIETMEGKRAEGENVSTRGGANLEMVERELINLAHGLELQGRYLEAAEVHPHEREKKRLHKIEEAISRDDGEFCECSPTVAKLGKQEIEVQPFYEVKKIYSRKHGRLVSLVGCQKCPDLNATPTPPEQVAAQLAATDGAAKAVKENPNVRLPNDVQLLRKQQSNS